MLYQELLDEKTVINNGKENEALKEEIKKLKRRTYELERQLEIALSNG